MGVRSNSKLKRNRRLVQLGFVALTVVGVFVVKGNAERWCPFGGVEAIYTYTSTGNMPCSLGISNFYILGAILVLTLLMRRAFCGYVCPIGAVSEWVQSGARRVAKVKAIRVPSGVDKALSMLKYGVLALILYLTFSSHELLFRAADPCYALLSRHGEDITFWAYVVAGGIIVLSLLFTVPFCRWLCPLGAVLNVFSRFGVTRVQRHEFACTGCGLCTKACPTAIPVHKVDTVTQARCYSCLNCVDVCPFDKAGAISWGPAPALQRWLGHKWSQTALIAAMFLLISGAVVAFAAFPLPAFVQTVDGRGPAPEQTATVDLKVDGFECRGRGTLFMYFVSRDDMYEVPGYLKIEASPNPNGPADVQITYDPSQTDPTAIHDAIISPYYDSAGPDPYGWRESPFTIEGYDPFDLDGLLSDDGEDAG